MGLYAAGISLQLHRRNRPVDNIEEYLKNLESEETKQLILMFT